MSSPASPIHSTDLPALVPAIAAAFARAEAWVVVVQRRPVDRPGRTGDCLVPYTRAQYRVEAAEEWPAVWADATRVAALQPPQPVLIELAPHCRLPAA